MPIVNAGTTKLYQKAWSDNMESRRGNKMSLRGNVVFSSYFTEVGKLLNEANLRYFEVTILLLYK